MGIDSFNGSITITIIISVVFIWCAQLTIMLLTLFQKSYELEALTFRLRALEESVKLVKSNEIVVEENDLKQLDNCDQRWCTEEHLCFTSLMLLFTTISQEIIRSQCEIFFGSLIREKASTPQIELRPATARRQHWARRGEQHRDYRQQHEHSFSLLGGCPTDRQEWLSGERSQQWRQ